MRPLATCTFAALLALSAAAGSRATGGATAPSSPPAVERLLAGNARFVAGKPARRGNLARQRAQLATGQSPFAVIVSCSDSRVAPEFVFDQGLGDLFVVRSAGEVSGPVELASVQYAIEHLGTGLVLVVGHERCGAAAAAIEGGEVHGHLKELVAAIQPAVEEARQAPGDLLENTVLAGVRRVVNQYRQDETLAPRVRAGTLTILGARHDLDTGRVEILQD